MPPASLDDLQAFAHATAGPRHDAYSEQLLEQAFKEYLPKRAEPLAPFELSAGGREYPSVYAAFADPDQTFAAVELRLVHPIPEGAPWDFLRPFRTLTFHPDGSAQLIPLDPERPAERAILRVMVREHYLPQGRPAADAPAPSVFGPMLRTQLAPMAPAVRFIREQGLLPLGVALLLYFPAERVRFELDLIGDRLLKDPRAGKLPISRWVHRPSRVAHGMDAWIARGEISVLTARALEVLIETHGVSALEMSRVLGGVRELAASALQSLVARRIATFDRRTGLYRVRLEAFLSSEERDRIASVPPASLTSPALRTSVMELLSAAESRATCPLCGDPLPAGHRGILCARCEAEVNASGVADASTS